MWFTLLTDYTHTNIHNNSDNEAHRSTDIGKSIWQNPHPLLIEVSQKTRNWRDVPNLINVIYEKLSANIVPNGEKKMNVVS